MLTLLTRPTARPPAPPVVVPEPRSYDQPTEVLQARLHFGRVMAQVEAEL